MGRVRTIGLKYCGGCNPRYDRVAVVDALKKKLKGKVVFVPWDRGGFDTVLVVVGCKTACIDLSVFDNCTVRLTTTEKETAAFAAEISEENGE